MSEYVSQREFARRVDRSHVWINRLVRDGRLPANDRGQIPYEKGLEAFKAEGLVADMEVIEHNKRQREKGKRKRGVSRSTSNKKSKPDTSSTPSVSIPDSGGGVSVARINEQYNKARLAEKTYQAKLKELEFKEAEGLLIPVDEVRRDATETAGELRAKLFGIPARISAQCEGKQAREIEKIITKAINEALKALHESRFGHDNT